MSEYGRSLPGPRDNPEHYDRHDNEAEEIGVRGPLGVGMFFKGHQSFSIVVMLLLTGIFCLLLWMHDANSQVRAQAIMNQMGKLEAEAKHGHDVAEKADETQRTMIYVLTLSQAEREKLRLEEPPQLKEMRR